MPGRCPGMHPARSGRCVPVPTLRAGRRRWPPRTTAQALRRYRPPPAYPPQPPIALAPGARRPGSRRERGSQCGDPGRCCFPSSSGNRRRISPSLSLYPLQSKPQQDRTYPQGGLPAIPAVPPMMHTGQRCRDRQAGKTAESRLRANGRRSCPCSQDKDPGGSGPSTPGGVNRPVCDEWNRPPPPRISRSPDRRETASRSA